MLNAARSKDVLTVTVPAGTRKEASLEFPPVCQPIEERQTMSIIWTIIIGFLAGVLAKFFMPGKNEPSGFIMTTILGIVGAFVASYLGQALGWYGPGEGAGLIGAVVGAVIVLFVWGMVTKNRTV